MTFRWNLILSGRVQHVGLRYRVRMAAQQLRLTGWVRNLADGTVELELQGEQHDIDSLLAHIHELPCIQYTILHVEEKEPIAENSFRIRY